MRGDNLDLPALTAAMKGADFVFHLAANADIKDGWSHPRKDLEQNTIATFNVLEAMRANKVRRIAFSSTGSVYGEAALVTPDRPTPETDSLSHPDFALRRVQDRGRGPALLAGRAARSTRPMFSASSRFSASATPTAMLFDFYQQLLAAIAGHLRVLGDGSQRKSYLYVQDCASTRCCT